MSKAHPNEMEGIYNFIFPFLKGNFVGQRIVAATVLAEFINHCQVKKKKIIVFFFVFF